MKCDNTLNIINILTKYEYVFNPADLFYCEILSNLSAICSYRKETSLIGLTSSVLIGLTAHIFCFLNRPEMKWESIHGQKVNAVTLVQIYSRLGFLVQCGGLHITCSVFQFSIFSQDTRVIG